MVADLKLSDRFCTLYLELDVGALDLGEGFAFRQSHHYRLHLVAHLKFATLGDSNPIDYKRLPR